MRYSFIFLLLFNTLNIFSQSDSLSQLQMDLHNLNGLDLVKAAVKLSDAFYESEQYHEASRRAALAFHEASKIDHKEYMAIALNKEARAMVKNKKGRKRDGHMAITKFGESLGLLHANGIKNKELEADNLFHLQKAAEFLDKKNKLRDLGKKLNFKPDSVINNIVKAGEELFVREVKPHLPVRRDGEQEPHQEVYTRQRDSMIRKFMTLNQKRLEIEMEKLEGMDIPPVIEQKNKPQIDLSDWESNLVDDETEIEEELIKEQKKIERLNAREAREELLLAQYKSKYDSLEYLHAVDSINLAKQELEIQNQNLELGEQKARRSIQMVGSGSTLLLSLFLLFGFLQQKRNNKRLSQKKDEIQKEQERSEELLLNILPAEVADELKQYGAAKAHKFDSVSVLFSDFKNFSSIAESMSPEELVSDLDYCFKAFDNIISKHQLEKIKTIGDAYMCAGGLPSPDDEHASKTVYAAMEMQQFLEAWKVEKQERGEAFFEARIGIHTGPIVAGVVGVKKFAYDIWGDTVNIASRMESGGEPGKINISGSTFEQTGEAFSCTYRGKINAKNRGDIDMYFVDGTRELVS